MDLPVESEIESNLRESFTSNCNVPQIANSYRHTDFLFANCATFGEFVIGKDTRMIDLRRAIGGFNEIDIDVGVIKQNNPRSRSSSMLRVS